MTEKGFFSRGANDHLDSMVQNIRSTKSFDSTAGAETERGKIWLDNGASAGQFLSGLDSFAATSIAEGFSSSAQVAMQHNTLKPPEHEGQKSSNIW